MNSILSKLFTGTSEQAAAKILEIYRKQNFCIVDYLYFAPIASHYLLEQKNVKMQNFASQKNYEHMLLDEYKKKNKKEIQKMYQDALQDADVVLPDGIALQILYFLHHRKRLHNLNGTDFCPYFLEYVQKHEKKINIFLYGTTPELIGKTKTHLEKWGYNVVYAQDGYGNFDREKTAPHGTCPARSCGSVGTINILLVGRATIDFPIQEIRSYVNKEKIKQLGLLVLNQGGTFDFWVGKQKRAPQIVRFLKGERLRRVISDPRRNRKKVLQSLQIFRYIFSYLLLKKR